MEYPTNSPLCFLTSDLAHLKALDRQDSLPSSVSSRPSLPLPAASRSQLPLPRRSASEITCSFLLVPYMLSLSLPDRHRSSCRLRRLPRWRHPQLATAHEDLLGELHAVEVRTRSICTSSTLSFFSLTLFLLSLLISCRTIDEVDSKLAFASMRTRAETLLGRDKPL